MSAFQPSGLPAAGIAKALVRSLMKGTAIPQGVRFIHVGHSNWLHAQDELLDEVADDGFADTKFVRGSYGSGKSHFLAVVQDHARERNWATTHVECRQDGVQLDRCETLYPQIASKLAFPDTSTDAESYLNPIVVLLEKWAAPLLRKAGVSKESIYRPFDVDSRLFNELSDSLFRTNLPPDFVRALTAFVRASAANDRDTTRTIALWVGGCSESVRIPEGYFQRPAGMRRSSSTALLRQIGKGTAREALRGLLWLIRAAGYSGLVLCIDEIEELAKLGTRRRQDQALQLLRECVDNASSDVGFRHLCMYLAATPAMFDSPDHFPRYDALATRIQPIGQEISWRAPVIDLDRTPLEPLELQEMGAKILLVYQAAYSAEVTQSFSEVWVRELVTHVTATRFRIAKPRLLTRFLVEELEQARQQGKAYLFPTDLGKATVNVAQRLTKEAGL